MATQQVVQELKAERVQEELMAAEGPHWIWLKAERVQEPGLAAAGAEGKPSFLKLAVSQQQKVSIELLALQVVVTLHGQAGRDPATSPGEAR